MPDYLDLNTFKETLHYDGDDDDTVLIALLDTAEQYIGDPSNGILRRPVVMTDFTEKFTDFYSIEICYPDGAKINDVIYVDIDGVQQSIAAIYELDGSRLDLIPGQIWPAHTGSVQVLYSAGFATIPEPIKSAGYFYAGTLFEAQGDASKMKPNHLNKLMSAMLAGYRRTTI